MSLLKNNLLKVIFTVLSIHISLSSSLAQQNVSEKDQYQIGPDERLLITVHLFGEVRRPGEFIVPDNTDILELISKAGGPTEFSNLGNVKITRGLSENIVKEMTSKNKKRLQKYNKKVIKINLEKILDNENYNESLPILQPGDIVRVARNNWFKWQAVIRVISQVAIVVQAWYWYSRIE